MSESKKPRDSNLVYCPQCYRPKLQFKSKREADDHMLWNSSEIFKENGKAPIRSYWCSACCCYHTTSKPGVIWEQDQDRSEILTYLGQALVCGDNKLSREHIVSAYDKLLENQHKPWAQETANKILMCLHEIEKKEEE